MSALIVVVLYNVKIVDHVTLSSVEASQRIAGMVNEVGLEMTQGLVAGVFASSLLKTISNLDMESIEAKERLLAPSVLMT